MVSPKQIRTNHDFMNSVFKDGDCETVLRNIIMLQKKKNSDEWTPFSWEDYKEFCTHSVTNFEKDILNAFVNGGKPMRYSSAYLSQGWLNFDGTNYSFTEKMVNMLSEQYSIIK